MAKRLTDSEKQKIQAAPEAHTKEELVRYLDEAGLDSKGNKEDLIPRVRRGDDGTYEPETFAARFDPADPPEKDPGPVSDEEYGRASVARHTGEPVTAAPGGPATAGAGGGAGGAGGTAGGTGNVGNAGTPGGGSTTSPGGSTT